MLKYKSSTLHTLLSTASALAILLSNESVCAAAAANNTFRTSGTPAAIASTANWKDITVDGTGATNATVAPGAGASLQLGGAHNISLTSTGVALATLDLRANSAQSLSVDAANSYSFTAINSTGGIASNVINLSYTAAGQLAIGNTNGYLGAVAFAGNNGSLTITTGNVNGAISATTAGVGTLNINGTTSVSGTIGASKALAAINIADGASLSLSNAASAANITLSGSGNLTTSAALNGAISIAKGTLTAGANTTVTGNVTFTDAGTWNTTNHTILSGDIDFAGNNATVILTSHSSAGNIDNTGGGTAGNIIVQGSGTASQVLYNIGYSNPIYSLNINSGASFNTNNFATAATRIENITVNGTFTPNYYYSLQANNISVGAGGYLYSPIDGGVIEGIGGGNAAITISEGGTLHLVRMTTFNPTVIGTVNLANGGNLFISNGSTVSGGILGSGGNITTYSYGGNVTISNITSTALNPINSIFIKSGAPLTLNGGGIVYVNNIIITNSSYNLTNGTEIQYNLLTLGAGATFSSSSAIYGIGGAGNAGSIVFDSSAASLNLNAGSELTGFVDFLGKNGTVNLNSGKINQYVDSSTIGIAGTINAQSGNSTIGGIIGGTNAISAINVSNGATLTAGSAVSAKTITLTGTGSTTLAGALQSNTIAIASGTFTVGGNVAGIGGNAAVSFTGVGTFNLGTNTLTGSVDFANQNATLTLGAGSSVSQTVDSTVGSNGTINVTGNSTVTGNIGGTNAISAINVSNGATLTAGSAVSAKTITLTGTGGITLGGALQSNILSIGSATVSAGGNVAGIGGNTAVSFTGVGTFNLGTNTLTGSVDFAGFNSALNLATGGKITGAVDGDAANNATIAGTINVTGNSTITGNIGGTKAVANINITGGAKLTNAAVIKATNVTLGVGSSISSPTTNIYGNLTAGANSGVTGDLNLSGATLNLSNNTLAVIGNVTATGNLIINTIVNGANTGNLVTTASNLNGSTITINIDNTSTIAAGNVTLISNVTADTANAATINYTGATTGYTFKYGSGVLSIAANAPAPGPAPATPPAPVTTNYSSNGSYSFIETLKSLSTSASSVVLSNKGASAQTVNAVSISSIVSQISEITNYLETNITGDSQQSVQAFLKEAYLLDSAGGDANLSQFSKAVSSLTESIAPIRSNDTISTFAVSASNIIKSQNGGWISSGVNVGLAAGEEEQTRKFGVWVQGFANKTKQKLVGKNDGYKSLSSGGIIGVETLVSDNLKIGIAGVHGESKVKMKNNRTGESVSTSSWIMNLYGSYEIDKKWLVTAMASGGYSKVKAKERVLGEFAIGKYGSKLLALDLGLSYRYNILQSFIFSPEIALKASGFLDESYTQRTNKISRSTAKRNGYNYQFSYGASLMHNFKLKNLEIETSVFGKVSREFKGKYPDIRISLEGQNGVFISSGNVMNKTMYNFGGDVTLIPGIAEYKLGYEVNKVGKYLSQTGTLKLRVNL